MAKILSKKTLDTQSFSYPKALYRIGVSLGGKGSPSPPTLFTALYTRHIEPKLLAQEKCCGACITVATDVTRPVTYRTARTDTLRRTLRRASPVRFPIAVPDGGMARAVQVRCGEAKRDKVETQVLKAIVDTFFGMAWDHPTGLWALIDTEVHYD